MKIPLLKLYLFAYLHVFLILKCEAKVMSLSQQPFRVHVATLKIESKHLFQKAGQKDENKRVETRVYYVRLELFTSRLLSIREEQISKFPKPWLFGSVLFYYSQKHVLRDKMYFLISKK